MYVPFFRCESFPYISRRAALFPFHSPCTPLVIISVPCMSFQFPFVSLSFPAAFLTCGLPMSFPHFLALPCMSPLLPNFSRKKTLFFQRFRKEDVQKHIVFQISAKGGRNPKPAKSRQGKTTFSGTSSNCRAVVGGGGGWGGGWGRVSDVGRGYPLSSLRCPTRRAMSADSS